MPGHNRLFEASALPHNLDAPLIGLARALAEEGMASTAAVAERGESTTVPLVNGWEAAAEFFLAPILPFLQDESVTEIMVNGSDQVFIERNGLIEATSVRFQDEEAVQAAAIHIAQFVGRRIGIDRPILDGRLPTGHRVCIVLAPLASAGATITIRKFSQIPIGPELLLRHKTVTRDAWSYLTNAVHEHANILVSGGTGTGKTTILGALASTFDPQHRVIVLEDTRELQLSCPHIVRLESRPPDRHGRGAVTIRDLFVTSLRMRPDRLIVGEVRGAEALDMIQAMTSGHRGSLSTLHANSPLDACHRLETMAMLAGLKLSLLALRRQVESAIDLVVQLARFHDGQRRIIAISRIQLDSDGEAYRPEPIFQFDRDRDSLQRVA